MTEAEARNVLVIHFGQMGDVVLALPALRRIRERFAHARITVACGRSTAAIVELSGYADEILSVDRVSLRDGNKLVSALRVAGLMRDVRRRRFDLVIDLHSLRETNVLGFLSGAPRRLFARRENRSLDFLGTYAGVPRHDFAKHIVDRYLDVLLPLGVAAADEAARTPRLRARAEDERAIETVLRKVKVDTSQPMVGIFPGAGHASRRWAMDRFAELARRIEASEGARVILFAGPEERPFVGEMRQRFGRDAVILDRLTVPQLAAALARLSVFVSNDTGPVHVAAAVGAPAVVIVDRPTPNGFNPVGAHHHVIYARSLDALTVEEVHDATLRILNRTNRTASLFSER